MSVLAQFYKLLPFQSQLLLLISNELLPKKTLEHIFHEVVSYRYKTGFHMYWTFCHTQILLIHKMGICFWKPQFESMAQDFGDQAFRDC